MSQSPREAGEAGDVYSSAWTAVNKLMRRGMSWSGHERNCAFLNVGDGTFARVDAVSGFGFYDDGRAAVRIDWDLDGDLDLVVTNRNGPRVRVLRNELADPGHFTAFRLRGVTCNKDAIGARVEVHYQNGESAVRTLRAGEGYLAQQSSWVHFGVPADRTIDHVVVRWPGGEPETFRGVLVGRRYVLGQGSATAERWDPPRGEIRLAPSAIVPPPATERARVVIPTPLIMPRLTLEGPEEGMVTSTWGYQPGRRSTPTGRPILLLLTANWCAPCAEELQAFRARAEDVRQSGLAVVALGVEQGEERAAGRAMLEGVGWPYPAIFASPETLDILDVLQGMLLDRDTRMPLPSSFLVDASGLLLAMYFGPADPDTVLADLALASADADTRLASATPFGGAWGKAPAPIDLAALQARFASRGLGATAREIAIGNTEVREQTRAVMLHDFGRRAGDQGRWDDAIRYFRQALEEDPTYAEAWGDLGVALARSGKPRQAMDAYGQALLRDPDLVPVRLNLGLAHVALGNRSAAEEHLRYLRRGEHPEAEQLAKAIEAMPKDDGDAP